MIPSIYNIIKEAVNNCMLEVPKNEIFSAHLSQISTQRYTNSQTWKAT